MIWYDMISYDMILYDIRNFYHMVSYDMIWYDMIWYDIRKFYHIISYDIIGYDIISYHIILYHIRSRPPMPAPACHFNLLVWGYLLYHWYFTVLYGTVVYCKYICTVLQKLYCIAWNCTVLTWTIVYCIKLYCIV